MPFGLKNAAQTFQRLVDRLFSDFPQVFVYLDGNLVATATVSEHLAVLRRVFSVLESNGLVLNVDECSFLQSEIDFLGHRVSAGGPS